MPFAGGVVREHDIAGFKYSLDTLARFDFPRAGKSHQKLTPGRGMAIKDGTGRNATEQSHGCGTRIAGEDFPIAAEFNFDLFKVGSMVAAGVESGDFHCSPDKILISAVRLCVPIPRL